MNRMSFFDKKTGLIGLVWTILLFGPGYFSYIERQKQMPIKAKIAFTKAIVEEKNLFIHRFRKILAAIVWTACSDCS